MITMLQVKNADVICIHVGGPVIWNNFLIEIEKNIPPQHFFKCKIKKKIFEFEEELSFF